MILMLAPKGGMSFGSAPSGSTYVADAYAVVHITNNSAADQTYLANAGCYTLTPFGGWGAAAFNTLAALYAADLDTGLILPGQVGFPQYMMASVYADPTSGNNGTWAKTGTGNGSGNWTQISTQTLAQLTSSVAALTSSVATLSASVANITAGVTTPSLSTGNAAFAVIQPNGWQVLVYWKGFKAGGTSTLNPNATPRLVLQVVDQGFTSTGQPTLISRTVVGTVNMRAPWPIETTPIDVADANGSSRLYALSEPIYAASNVAGSGLAPITTVVAGLYLDNGSGGSSGNSLTSSLFAMNGSALTYPPPVANWVCSAYQRAGSNGFQFEVYADHQFGFNASPVAQVGVRVTDSAGNKAYGYASTLTQSAQVATTDPNPLVFPVIVSTSGLVDGAATADILVWPWIGNTVWDSKINGATWPTPQVCSIPVLIDAAGNYTPAYACVDTAAGVDASGVVSTTQATAEAAPYKTWAAARAAIKTFNNARGHNDHAAGVVLLTQDLAGFGENLASTLTPGLTWFTIGHKSTVSAQTIGFTTASSDTNATLATRVAFNGLYLRSTSATNLFDGGVDGAVSGLPQIYVNCTNCKLSQSAVTNAVPLFYQTGLMDYIGCTFTNCGPADLTNYSVTRQHHRLHLGTTYTTTSTSGPIASIWTAIGCTFNGCNFQDTTAAAQPYQQSVDGLIHVNNKWFGMRATSNYSGARQWTKGIVVAQSVYELVTGTVPALQVSADGMLNPVANVIRRFNTIAGGRTNFLYNDIGAVPTVKTGVSQYNLDYQYNIKRDPFNNPTGGQSGNRTGNWMASFGVGCFGNHAVAGATGNDTGGSSSTPGPDSWLGEFTGLASTNNVAVTFTTDASYLGTGAGGGNYLPTGTVTTLQGKVAAGRQPYPSDIHSTARKNTGTGSCGAYEVG